MREGVSYRSVKTDAAYLNNWVDKLGMLCESQSNIGFLGSSYYIGIVVAMLVIPALSDCYGRKTVFVATMILQVFSQYGLMVAQNLHEATFYMIIAGACWPGKRVAGLNYQLEFIPESLQANYITFFSMFDYPSLLLISMLYQYISVDWFPQQAVGIVMSCVCLFYCHFYMPESPKFLYVNEKYDEVREIMKQMAGFNGKQIGKNYRFEKEIEDQLIVTYLNTTQEIEG